MEDLKNNYNLLVAKKTEKIVTAIYLITQFLNDNEDLKISIRSEADALLRTINKIAYEEDKEIFSLYRDSISIISLLISFLTIAKDSSLISSMNTSIVLEGLYMLENILIKKQFILQKENLYINEEDILLSLVNENKISNINRNTSYDTITSRTQNQNRTDNFSKNTDKKKEVFGYSQIKSRLAQSSKIENIKDIKSKEIAYPIKDNIYSDIAVKDKIGKVVDNRLNPKEFILYPKTIKSSNKSIQNKDRKNSRQNQILALFTKGVEVSINDISKKIVGCSVKTIQRELNDLVEEKKINKIGEKRWSKYILSTY